MVRALKKKSTRQWVQFSVLGLKTYITLPGFASISSFWEIYVLCLKFEFLKFKILSPKGIFISVFDFFFLSVFQHFYYLWYWIQLDAIITDQTDVSTLIYLFILNKRPSPGFRSLLLHYISNVRFRSFLTFTLV